MVVGVDISRPAPTWMCHSTYQVICQIIFPSVAERWNQNLHLSDRYLSGLSEAMCHPLQAQRRVSAGDRIIHMTIKTIASLPDNWVAAKLNVTRPDLSLEGKFKRIQVVPHL